jgi:uncharacterized protein YjbI with pentapeptide repeats
MKVMKPMALSLLTRPYEMGRRYFLGVSVIAFVPLGHEAALFSDIGMWKFLADELPPDQPLDTAIPKRAGEYLITARACAPPGTEARAVRVRARFGARSKELLVAGDRHVEGGRATSPLPFKEMPIDWQRAYGGPKFAANPLGRGLEEEPIQGVGFRVRLANVLDPALPPHLQQQQPAGFGPMDVTWPQRARFAGTYGDVWLRDDFPGFPRDIDWRFFNIAPEDQTFPGPLQGSEEYAFENMHPTEPELTGRLPGIAARAFVVRRGTEDLEEVPLALTTAWFFPHRKRAVLVHHGAVPVREEDARDVVRMLIGADRAGALRPTGDFATVMAARLDPKTGSIASLRDTDLAPPDLIVPDPDIEAEKVLHQPSGIAQKQNRRRMELEADKTRALVASYGLDPDEHGPAKVAPLDKPPTLDELPAHVERMMAQAEERRKLEDARQVVRMAELRKTLDASGVMTAAQLDAELATRPSGPPKFTAAGMRAEMVQLSLRARATGGDPYEINQYLADPNFQMMWDQTEATVREAYRLGAHLQDPAPWMDEARQSDARARLGSARDWPRANLCGADLRGLDLSGRDFSEAWFDASQLADASLMRSLLRRAVLAHAVLVRARLDHADLTEANLGAADLRGASLAGAKLTGATLSKALLAGAVLKGADLSASNLSDLQAAGADFGGAMMTGVIVLKTSLPGFAAPQAILDQATFVECDLNGARFAGASLVGTTFVNCTLRGVDFSGATLRNARFVEGCVLQDANLAAADLTEANLRGVPLRGARMQEAVLDSADFSDCDLSDARLDHVLARNARFVAADMRRAVLARGDFMSAMLGRADLRGADLSSASFYEADLARVRTDSATRHEGMLQTRMRLRPRWQEPLP